MILVMMLISVILVMISDVMINCEDDLRIARTNDDVSGNNACYLDGVDETGYT